MKLSLEKESDFKKLKFELLQKEILESECVDYLGQKLTSIFHDAQNSKIFQISQAPSLRVHLSGLPFDDISGRILKYGWYGISDDEFYDTDNFYLTDILHCFPGKNKVGRDLSTTYLHVDKWLKREMEVVDNEIYILVGKIAANYFFPKRKFEELVFEDQVLNGKRTFVIPHPSPLNRFWLKKHGEFEGRRVLEVRENVREILKNKIE